MMRTFAVAGWIAVGVATSGCTMNSTPVTPTPPDAPAPPPAQQNCVSSQARFAIGEPASAELLERARVAAEAATARFLQANQAITLEYVGSRLNLELDTTQVVRAVRCG
jgi:hypothetical protein